MSQISIEILKEGKAPVFIPKFGSATVVFTQHIISIGIHQSKTMTPNPVLELHMFMSDGNKREFFYSSLEDLNKALLSLGLKATIEE